MRLILFCLVVVATFCLISCISNKTNNGGNEQILERQKIIIYQTLPRLFGNKEQANIPWGTVNQNGVGKFNDITHAALRGIKELGVSHIWYTGVIRHALITDYSAYGITPNDPDIVKGRAGSPYAITDYYDVNPDLAVEVDERMREFLALIDRTHQNGMKVIIDIVPNHVAREYDSNVGRELGRTGFGERDLTKVDYAKHNNFYYLPNSAFEVPTSPEYQVLGGHAHPDADGYFYEMPAKWTGNLSANAKPSISDWYETVKLNYGVTLSGEYDFVALPQDFSGWSLNEQYSFWQTQDDLPDTWLKMRDIVFYWLEKGVDGFRFDMAEMVPIHFWNYLNSAIKQEYPETLLVAEIYNPKQYRNFITTGRMDYLYHKVDLYDDLKAIIQNRLSTDALTDIYYEFEDIQEHLLHFLENHDEQRIASPQFAGSATKGKPALVVNSLLNDAPLLHYFGQEVGEDGSEDMGFGKQSRTTIFDYADVPAHQRWMNNGKFDGGLLSEQEQALRAFYQKVMHIAAYHPTMNGQTSVIHDLNKSQAAYTSSHYSFVRYTKNSALVVATNFSDSAGEFTLKVPVHLLSATDQKSYEVTELITQQAYSAQVIENYAHLAVSLDAWDSLIFEIDKQN